MATLAALSDVTFKIRTTDEASYIHVYAYGFTEFGRQEKHFVMSLKKEDIKCLMATVYPFMPKDIEPKQIDNDIIDITS